jgi:Spy/CpxP family protein refolding chaperone
MKTTNRFIAATIAAVALGVAGAALAHPGMGMGPGYGMGYGMGPGMGYGMGYGPGMGYGMGPGFGRGMGGPMWGPVTAEAVAADLAGLKAALKIAPLQEPTWQKYETLLRQQAEAAQAMRSAMLAQMKDPASADFAAQREAMFKLRETHLQAGGEARNELLAVLTPEQKTLFAQRGYAGHGRRMSMHGPAW